MIQLNYQDWTRYRSKEQYEKLDAKGIDVAVMEPLRGGALARLNDPAKAILRQADPDASPASWAFRWVASLPRVKLINSGMGRESDLEDNIRTFSPVKELTDDERGSISAALAAFQRTQAVPCTACRYCVPCPAGVAIPEIFSLWNAYKEDGNKRSFLARYETRIPEDARASECVRCMRCTKHCPQKIAIPDELAKIDAEVQALRGEA